MLSHLYSLLVLAIAIFTSLLGSQVLVKNPYHRPGRAFFLTMLLISARCVFHFGMLNSPDEGTALVWGKAAMAAGVLLSGSLCYLASYLPYSRYEAWPVKNARVFWVAVAALAIFFGLAADGIKTIDFGYGLDYSTAVMAGYVVSLVMSTGASAISLTARQGSRDSSFRSSILLMAAAPLIPFVSMIFLMALGLDPLFAPGLLISALIYAFLVLKHRVLNIGASTRPAKLRSTENGDSILVEGRTLRPAYELFLTDIKEGRPGMVVCRRHPDRIREEIGLNDLPMLWLSSQPGPDRVDPTSLNILQHSITVFVEKASPAVILLEGVEYLISQNSLDKVLRMLYSIRDTVTVSGSKLIMPMDPEVLHQRELALMEKEFTLERAEA